jgi:uncharacterized protein (TIGR03067 family)
MKWWLTAVVTAGLFAPAANQGDDARKELEQLQGKWAVVSVERDGKADERWKDAVRTIEGNKYVLAPKEGAKVEGTFKIDPVKKPKVFDSEPAGGQYKGKTLLGIYAVEGDTLKICFAEPGKDRPTEFASKPGSGWVLAVHKREK